MKISSEKSKVRLKLLLLSLPVLALAGFAYYLRQPPAYLVGRWKVGKSLELWQTQERKDEDWAIETTFNPNGTWETVVPSLGSTRFTVTKGRYSASGSGFRLFGHKIFGRAQRADRGNDVLFVPAPSFNIGDCCDWQIYNYNQELAAKGEEYQVMSFDKVTRKMVTQDETQFGGTKPRIEHRTWIKQP